MATKHFEPGDIVIDYHCAGPGSITRSSFTNPYAYALVGVVARVDRDVVWGDWRYGDGWRRGMTSHIDGVEHYVANNRDQLWADYVRWRLEDRL